LVPAPEVELGSVEPVDIQREIDRLKRRITQERPADVKDVYNWLVQAGNHMGAGGDLITVSYAISGHEMPKALDQALERFGLVFAITTCLQKQFVSGEPAGWDAAYETAKFLTGKIAGGGAAAAIGLLKYSLDTFGNAASAQIDLDFYRAYSNWHLQEHPDFKFYFDLYAQPGGGDKVAQILDSFWNNPAAQGIRGYGLLITTYKGDLDNVKAAYRQKFLKEHVYTAMENIWQDQLLDAEVELLLEGKKLYSANKAMKKIRIDIKEIVDRGTAKGAGDLQATLIHSGKYMIAQAAVNGNGVRFEFNAGKLIHPETLKPVSRVTVMLEPVNGAQFAFSQGREIPVELTGKHPRTLKQFEEGLTTFQLTKPFYVHMAYPITVTINDDGAKITRIQAQVVPGKPGYRSAASFGQSASKKEGVFAFEKLPTGKCTFSYGTRSATKMITGKERITLDPPAAVQLDAAAPMPPMPDLASVNNQRLQALQQLRHFDKFEADVQSAIGEICAKMSELKAEYEAGYNTAMETIRDQESLLGKQKGMDSTQRQALKQQLSEKRTSLQTAEKAVRKNFSELEKSYSEADRMITKEIREEDRQIQDAYQRARDEMSAEQKRVGELEDQIQKAVREVASELHHNALAYKTQAEAEATIGQLEQDVAQIDDLVQQIQASVEAGIAARQRFEAQLEAQERRRYAREQLAPSLPSILAAVDQNKRLLDSLRKNAVVEKTKRAAQTVKKRHELRNKNAAEFARLLDEVKTLGAQLPDVDATAFDNAYQQASTQFVEILGATEGSSEALEKVLSRVKAFLDGNQAVIGDLRDGRQGTETAYARIEMLSRKITEMVSSAMVYAGPDYYKVWEPIQAKLITAATVRAGSGRRLISLEKDLHRANADLADYRRQVATAVAETETLVTQAANINGDKTEDVGTVLNTLDNAWIKTEQLPICIRSTPQSKIIAAAENLAANGSLVKYAEASKRPLVVFDSYWMDGDFKNEIKLNKPILRCKSGPGAYTSVNLKAEVIGLPPGQAALIAVENDWWRNVCPRDQKTGLHFVNLTLMGNEVSRIRVLGTGKANPPIEYPFFRQVAFQ
jgi:hypothetical protein